MCVRAWAPGNKEAEQHGGITAIVACQKVIIFNYEGIKFYGTDTI